MMFACYYDSPLGKLLLTADALGLTGLYFDGEKPKRTGWPLHARSGKRRSLRRPSAGWTFIFRQPARFPAASAPGRFCVSAGCVGAPSEDPVWADDNVRRDRTPACRKAGHPENVCAGGGRCDRAQQDRHCHSMPPRHRRKRQPDRICRRHEQKSSAAGTGTYRYDRSFSAEEGTCTRTMSRTRSEITKKLQPPGVGRLLVFYGVHRVLETEICLCGLE